MSELEMLTKREMESHGGYIFHIGDHGNLATEAATGRWWITLDGGATYLGFFKSKHSAKKAAEFWSTP